MTRALLVLLSALLLASPAAAQHAFTMDYSAEAAPDAGWGTGAAYADRSTFTITRLAGGGPAGQDAYRMTLDYDAGASSFGGQFNWGWRAVLSNPSQPGNGDSQFYRWRMKMDAATNYRCRDWEDGSEPVNCINKILLINDGCGTSACRPIMTVESDRTAGNYQLVMQKDGGADQAKTPFYEEGVWIDVQLEVRWSSTNGAADGYYKLWIDNDTYASPTASATGIQLNVSDNPGYTRFGSYMNHGVASDGTYAWTHADFETGPTFDASWDAGAQECSTYYVDASDGSDSNDGCSEGAAWQTLGAVNAASLQPGDTVRLRRGRVWRETLTLPASGTDGNPITISDYGSGALPIISGANVVTGFNSAGTNLWAATVTTQPQVVFCDGTAGVNDATPDAPCEWTWADNTLTLFATSDPDNLYAAVEAGARSYGINLPDRDYITIENVRVQYANLHGVRMANAQHVTLQNSEVVWNADYGVSVEGGSPYSDDLLVANCVLSDNGERGLNILVGASNGPKRTELRHSTIARNGWSTTGTDWAQGVAGNFADGSIHDNVIEDNAGPLTDTAGAEHGIYLIGYTGQTNPVLIYQNTISGHSRGSGIKLSNASATIYRNRFESNQYDAVTFGESDRQAFTATLFYNLAVNNAQACFREALNATNAKTISLVNNTCVGGGIQASNNIAGGFTMRNNIVYVNGAVVLSMATQTAASINRNLLYRAGGSTSLVFYDGAARTWAEWQGFGFDAQGVNADPLFVSAGTGNYALQAGSPAVDLGTSAPDTVDFLGHAVPQGNAPDLGALEQDQPAAPGAVRVVRNAWRRR